MDGAEVWDIEVAFEWELRELFNASKGKLRNCVF